MTSSSYFYVATGGDVQVCVGVFVGLNRVCYDHRHEYFSIDNDSVTMSLNFVPELSKLGQESRAGLVTPSGERG